MMQFAIGLQVSAVGGAAAVAFLLVFLAVALVAFKLLKKSVKMAFRMLIVAIILLIAVAGSLSFWWLGTEKATKPRTTQSK